MQQYDLVSLRSFLAVIDAGSFVKAAELLDTSTASVSRRVLALETALGAQLLTRSTRHLDLTDAGRRFYDDLQNVFQLLDEAEERVRSGREKLAGTLRIAAPLSFGIQQIAPLIPPFMQQHPALAVQLHFEDRLTDLQSEAIDLSLRIGTLKDSALIATPICPIARVLCAAPAYLNAHGEPCQPAEMSQHACLHYSLMSLRDEWESLWRDSQEPIDIRCRLAANNAEALREAAIQGIGIAMLPEFVVRDALAEGRLCRILPDYQPEPLHLYAVRLSRRFTPARIRVFLEYIRHQLEDPATRQSR